MADSFYYGQQDYIQELNALRAAVDAAGMLTSARLDTAQTWTAKQTFNAGVAVNYLRATGLSTSWGATPGTTSVGLGVDMGTSTGATWLLHGASAGTFRFGIQAHDSAGSVRFYEGVNYFQFSSNILTATTFAGALSGNASTATKLATARTISGVPFDGSANITLTKTHIGLPNVDDTADLAKPLSTAAINALALKADISYVDAKVAELVDSAPGTLDTLNELAAALGDDPNFATSMTNQIASKEPLLPAGSNTTHYLRGDKTWQLLNKWAVGLGNVDDLSAASIRAGITSANVTSALGFSPSRRGGFAASPERSLASLDSRTIADPSTGIGYAGGMRARFGFMNDASGNYADIIDLSTYTDSSGGGYNALYFNKQSQQLQHKWGAAGATAWTTKTIAYTDSSITGNAATATTLATARTINGVSFNGSANITVADATKLPLTGGTLSGDITIADAAPVLHLQDTDNAGVGQMSYISHKDSGAVERAWVGYGVATDTHYRITNTLGDVILAPNSGIAKVGANTIWHAGNLTKLSDLSNDTGFITVGGITGGASSIATANLTASMALVSDAGGKVAAHATVSAAELGYLDGVTSGIQTQLNDKLSLASGGTVGGVTNFDNTLTTKFGVRTATTDGVILENIAIKNNSTIPNGYVKFVTPIRTSHNQMFSIDIVGYDYNIGKSIDFTVVGYAYAATDTVINLGFTNRSSFSRDVRIALEDRGAGYRVLVVALGAETSAGVSNEAWYFQKFSATVRGWAGNSTNWTPSQFSFVNGETTLAVGYWSSANVNKMNLDGQTGVLTAVTFSGALSGNASTATKLATARTIAGKSFDGTANITLSAADVGAVAPTVSLATSSNLSDVITSGFYRCSTHPDLPAGASGYGQLLVLRGSDTITQTYTSYGSGTMYTRSGNPTNVGGTGALTAWRVMLADHNFNTYAPTLTGTGASGTWGISVTGNAATATSATTATKLATARLINGVAFDGTQDITIGTGGAGTVTAVNGQGPDGSGNVVLTKTHIGLGSVDNTPDASKPVSTAQQAALDLKISASEKGAANGVVPLDADAKIAAVYLPSYVDDVLEHANLAAFPATGSAGALYVALDTNKVYRWSGSVYVEISGSPGSTDAVPEGSVNLYYTDARARAAITGAASTLLTSNLAASMALVSDASGKVAAHANVSATELGYLDGATSNIQTQLNNRVELSATSSTFTTAANGWYRIAQSPANTEQNSGVFHVRWTVSGNHGSARFSATCFYGQAASVNLQQIEYGAYGTGGIVEARIVYHTTYTGNQAFLEVKFAGALTSVTVYSEVHDRLGWTMLAPSTAGDVPVGYVSEVFTFTPRLAGGTATKVTYGKDGRITGTSALLASDIPTLNQSTTGNAATATKLATARTIAGKSFDGTADITLAAADVGAVPSAHMASNLKSSYAAAGDGVTDDTTAIANANNTAGVKFAPEGTYATTLAASALTGPYRGYGQIKDSSGNKRAPNYTQITARPTLGDGTSISTAFNGDVSKIYAAVEHRVTGAATLGQPTTGYLYTDEASPHFTYLYNEAGHNQATAGNSGRTGLAAYRTKLFNNGQGDVVAYNASVYVTGTRAGSTDFLANPGGVLLNGDVEAGADGVYLNPYEVNAKDNGFDAAALGQVVNLHRTNGTGAKSAVWLGFRLQSKGSAAVDAAFSAEGSIKRGLDLSAATLTADQAAIAMATGQRLYFGASASAAGNTAAGWYATSLGDNYVEYSNAKLSFHGGAGAGTQFQIGDIANAVNHVKVYGAASGGLAMITAEGETNASLGISSKDDGYIFLYAGNSPQFAVKPVGGSTAWLQTEGGAGTTLLSVQGSASNGDLGLQSKGTGKVRVNGKVLDLSGDFTTSGAFTSTFTLTGNTAVTLPTSGTLLSTAAAVTASQGGTGLSSYAVGDILYAATTTTLARLAPSTAGRVLVTNGSGQAPSWQPLDLGFMPTAWVKKALRAATTAALTASYGSNVLTNTGTLAALVLDGVTLVNGNRILVKNQANAVHNGVYDVTNVGSASVAWVLTRSGDCNFADEMGVAHVVITEGTLYKGTCWRTNFGAADVVGTSAINWFQVLDTGSVPTTPVLYSAKQSFGGSATSLAAVLTNCVEKVTIDTVAATSIINYDLTTQAILFKTTAAAANHTLNIRGNSSNTLNSLLGVGESVTLVYLNTCGATAYYPNVIQIDGVTVTPKWQGGTAPTAGNASSIDSYSFTIIKTAATPTYTVLASQTQFK